TPLTDGTYDLYWIAVDPATQGKGYGRRLNTFAESEVVRRGGRLLLIETASQEVYAATIRFCERARYEVVCRIGLEGALELFVGDVHEGDVGTFARIEDSYCASDP